MFPEVKNLTFGARPFTYYVCLFNNRLILFSCPRGILHLEGHILLYYIKYFTAISDRMSAILLIFLHAALLLYLLYIQILFQCQRRVRRERMLRDSRGGIGVGSPGLVNSRSASSAGRNAVSCCSSLILAVSSSPLCFVFCFFLKQYIIKEK